MVLAQDVPISDIPVNPYVMGRITITDVPDRLDSRGLPGAFVLHQNYPNPFNPATSIRYDLPSRDHVRLSVFNAIGQEVATLVDEVQEAGSKTVVFEARSFPSGVYTYRIRAGMLTESKRMILLK